MQQSTRQNSKRSGLTKLISLATGFNCLSYMQFNISPLCRLCNEANETFWHLLTECPWLKTYTEDTLRQTSYNRRVATKKKYYTSVHSKRYRTYCHINKNATNNRYTKYTSNTQTIVPGDILKTLHFFHKLFRGTRMCLRYMTF